MMLQHSTTTCNFMGNLHSFSVMTQDITSFGENQTVGPMCQLVHLSSDVVVTYSMILVKLKLHFYFNPFKSMFSVQQFPSPHTSKSN